MLTRKWLSGQYLVEVLWHAEWRAFAVTVYDATSDVRCYATPLDEAPLRTPEEVCEVLARLGLRQPTTLLDDLCADQGNDLRGLYTYGAV